MFSVVQVDWHDSSPGEGIVRGERLLVVSEVLGVFLLGPAVLGNLPHTRAALQRVPPNSQWRGSPRPHSDVTIRYVSESLPAR